MTGRDDLEGLPETYALALRLRAEGLDQAAIGRVLDIELESVEPLLDLAQSKLAGLAGDPLRRMESDSAVRRRK